MKRAWTWSFSLLLASAACGDLGAERVHDTGDETTPYTGEWADACEAYCGRLADCYEVTDPACAESCVLDQTFLPDTCQRSIGEVLWCAGFTECDELPGSQAWQQASAIARDDVEHPCHDLGVDVGPDCCI